MENYASRCLNQIAFRMGKFTREEFWIGKFESENGEYGLVPTRYGEVDIELTKISFF